MERGVSTTCDHLCSRFQNVHCQGIELLYTPIYSPEFNPAEFCFNKMKTLVKNETYRDIFKTNIELGIYEVLEQVTASDCLGFYKTVGYLDI